MWDFVRNQLDWLVFAVVVVVSAIFAFSYRDRVVAYVREVRQEWGRVTTPTREESVAHTVVVIVGVLLSAAYMFVVDLVLNPIMGIFYRG